MSFFDFGIPSLFKGASSFLHPERGYEKGQEQLNNYYNQSQNYLQPYNNQGAEAGNNLSTIMQKLLNPSQLHDEWLNNYQQSDTSQMAQDRAMHQGNRVAQSMGIGGSTPALRAIQAGTNEIGAQDEQRYIERMIQQYLAGAGVAQNVFGTGANAANAMSNNAYNMGNNSADMAYGRQNAPGQMFGNLLGAGASLYGGHAYNSNNPSSPKMPWSPTGGR